MAARVSVGISRNHDPVAEGRTDLPSAAAAALQTFSEDRVAESIAEGAESSPDSMSDGGYRADNPAPALPPGPIDDEELEYNDAVYLTDNWRNWERHFLQKVGKRIHRLVCSELSRQEEALFMLYVDHDHNLDGEVRGHESDELLQAMEAAAPGIGSEKRGFSEADGSVSFLTLLRWHDVRGEMAVALDAGLQSVTFAVVGSGMRADARLETLDWLGLRHNVVGYRRLLAGVREFQEERIISTCRQVESEDGLEAAMPAYYDALSREFDGDAELLFELFAEADTSGNMMLEESEVRVLLATVDTAATPEEVSRYVAEINLENGPLTYSSFLDWWDQARSVPNSLVSEKGAALLGTIKARSTGNWVGGFWAESVVKQRWRQANEEGRLANLRRAYCKTISELREYKMERNLRTIEAECSQL